MTQNLSPLIRSLQGQDSDAPLTRYAAETEQQIHRLTRRVVHLEHAVEELLKGLKELRREQEQMGMRMGPRQV